MFVLYEMSRVFSGISRENRGKYICSISSYLFTCLFGFPLDCELFTYIFVSLVPTLAHNL